MDCFSKTHRRLLYMAGVAIDDSDLAFKILWLGFKAISVVGMVYCVVGSMTHVALTVDNEDMGLAMAGCVSLLFGTQPICNMIVGIKLLPRVTSIFKFYIELLANSEDHVFDMRAILKKEFEKNTKADKLRMVILFIMGTMLISVYIITHFLYGMTDPPVVIWYPVDNKKRPIFISICMSQHLLISSVLLLGAVQDGLLHTIIRLQTVHAQYLAANLEYIPKLVDQNPRMAYEKLNWWIQQHQIKLKNETEVRNVFSPYLLVHYAITFAFVFTGLVSALIPTYSIAQKCAVTVFSMMYLVGLHRLCTLSEDYYQENENILRNGFSTNFIISGRVMAKSMVLIQTCCNKTHILSAYGLYPLSNESFGLLLQATFSYIVTTVQIREARAQKEELEK